MRKPRKKQVQALQTTKQQPQPTTLLLNLTDYTVQTTVLVLTQVLVNNQAQPHQQAHIHHQHILIVLMVIKILHLPHNKPVHRLHIHQQSNKQHLNKPIKQHLPQLNKANNKDNKHKKLKYMT
jgi:hypothetical protein